ncbi:hypothetical protein HMI55_002275 [Coelomomyces lativittatus]|nr:hypothetical protein HMI56_002185 [Coelomomyces lativittatus]KAJ1503885.1 hypothetical protein HMI55_002275 [Coelomomyces lativittatus]
MPQAQLMNLLQEKEQLQLKALKLETKLIHQTQRLREYETLSAFQWKGPQHDLPLVSELQLLRKLYFNVLVLSLKLQYSKNIAMDEVWDEFKTENVLSWPRLLTKKFEDLQV